ncbi:MAG: hypothetical protein AAB781_00985 [Patescibacteria group bacterium]
MATDLVNAPVKIIDSSEKKEAWIIRKLNDLKMGNVAVINLHCLNNFKNFSDLFNQFKKLIENAEVFKILHSEMEDDIKNLPTSINWRGREDVLYVGDNLEFTEDVIRRYWSWKTNFKSFISQSPYF